MKRPTSFDILFNSVRFSITLSEDGVLLMPAKPASPIIPDYNTYYPLPSVPIQVDFGRSVLSLGYDVVEDVVKTEFVPEFGYINLVTLGKYGVSSSYLSDYPHSHVRFEKPGKDWADNEDDKNLHDMFKDDLYYLARQNFEVMYFDGSHFNGFHRALLSDINSVVGDLHDMQADYSFMMGKNWDKLAYISIVKFYNDFGFNRFAFAPAPSANEREARHLRGGGAGQNGLSHSHLLTKIIDDNTCIVGCEQYKNDLKVVRRKIGGKQVEKDVLLRFNGGVDADKYQATLSLWNMGQKNVLVPVEVVPIKVVPENKNSKKRTEFSYRSRQSLRWVAQNTEVKLVSMLTLTYPDMFPNNGLVFKRHLNNFFKVLYYFLSKLFQSIIDILWNNQCSINDLCNKVNGKVEYLWFLEFQERGAVHVHILLDVDMSQFGDVIEVKSFNVDGSFNGSWLTVPKLQEWALASWARIVANPLDSHDKNGNHILWQPTAEGLKHHAEVGVRWEVLRDVDAAAKYVTKYATKTEQKIVPKGYDNVGNFWYASKGVRDIKPKAVFVCTEYDIKAVLPIVKAHESIQKKEFLNVTLYGVGKDMANTDPSLWKHHFLTLPDLKSCMSNEFVNFRAEEMRDIEGRIYYKYVPVFTGSHHQTDRRQISLADISEIRQLKAGSSSEALGNSVTVESQSEKYDEWLRYYELETRPFWVKVQEKIINGLTFNQACLSLGLSWYEKAMYLVLIGGMDISEAKNVVLNDEWQVEQDLNQCLNMLQRDTPSLLEQAMSKLNECVK